MAVAMDRRPAISEHGLVGGLRTAALSSKAYRGWRVQLSRHRVDMAKPDRR
jgi:hypothetical protein